MEIVSPGIGLILWMTVSFATLIFILRRFAWKPILKTLHDREATIDEALNQANKAREEMKNLKADNEKLLKEAQEERNVILRDSRKVKDEIIEQAREKANEEAKQVLEQNQANLAKAEEESKKIIEQSRNYAESLKEQMISDSKEQDKKIVDEASSEIQRKKDAAFEELKGQIAEIAVGAAEKIIRESLDSQKSKQVIDKYLNEVANN